MLEEVIGEVAVDQTLLSDQSKEAPKAPGMKYRHYAPKARLTIVEGEIPDVVKAIRSLLTTRSGWGKALGLLRPMRHRKIILMEL